MLAARARARRALAAMLARARRRRWQRYVDRLAAAVDTVLGAWEAHWVPDASFLPEEARLEWEQADEQFKAAYGALDALLTLTVELRDGLRAEARHAPVM